ncbi:MAG: FeoB-associated Cys-rich membrane protein [Candidatus Coproplasma sp.]
MGATEIVIAVLCALAVVSVIGTIIYKKVKGKSSGCGCGCANCPHACSGKSQTEHTD